MDIVDEWEHPSQAMPIFAWLPTKKLFKGYSSGLLDSLILEALFT